MRKGGCKSCGFSLIVWKIGVIVFSIPLFSGGDVLCGRCITVSEGASVGGPGLEISLHLLKPALI